MQEDLLMTYRKLVMSGDENHAGRLFGGSLLKWADEAAVLFAMCQMGTRSVVTLKISEVIFRNPSQSGDILEFWTRTKKRGNTSLTVECVVVRKAIGAATASPSVQEDPKAVILSCEFVFVAIDSDGRPVRHLLSCAP